MGRYDGECVFLRVDDAPREGDDGLHCHVEFLTDAEAEAKPKPSLHSCTAEGSSALDVADLDEYKPSR